jgi:integrase/recombinase XerD
MDLGQFAGFVEPARLNDVGSIGKEEIRTYLAALATRYATKSIKRKVASTKAMFRYLEFEEIVPVSPYRKLIVRLREPARLPRILDLASIHAMFRWAYGRMAAGIAPSLAARDVAVLELLFATGARVAEICQLRVGDLDLDNGTVRLLGKGRRERLIQIVDDEVQSALREYLEIRRSPCATDYLFENQRSGRLSEESVRSLLKRCGREAGLPSPITPHMIRHTVATLLLDEGVDIRQIQILLGHRSIRTTELYTHLSSEAQRRLLTSKHPRRHFRLRESP